MKKTVPPLSAGGLSFRAVAHPLPEQGRLVQDQQLAIRLPGLVAHPVMIISMSTVRMGWA